MNFAKNLLKTWGRLGISQQELADRLGVAQGAVGNWEAGIREPKLSQLKDIAKALETTPTELIK